MTRLPRTPLRYELPAPCTGAFPLPNGQPLKPCHWLSSEASERWQGTSLHNHTAAAVKVPQRRSITYLVRSSLAYIYYVFLSPYRREIDKAAHVLGLVDDVVPWKHASLWLMTRKGTLISAVR